MRYSREETHRGSLDFCRVKILERFATVRFGMAAVMILLGATISTRAQNALAACRPFEFSWDVSICRYPQAARHPRLWVPDWQSLQNQTVV